MAKVGKLKPQLFPTGLALWQLPDSMFQIMWPGPGSRLIFGTLTKPDGLSIHIDHPTANGTYATLREAQAAVEAFSAAAEPE